MGNETLSHLPGFPYQFQEFTGYKTFKSGNLYFMKILSPHAFPPKGAGSYYQNRTCYLPHLCTFHLTPTPREVHQQRPKQAGSVCRVPCLLSPCSTSPECLMTMYYLLPLHTVRQDALLSRWPDRQMANKHFFPVLSIYKILYRELKEERKPICKNDGYIIKLHSLSIQLAEF